MNTQWTLWSETRPTDPSLFYRWRIPARNILGLELRPEWTDKLHLCGMGYSDSEYWPGCSHWDGYRRAVPIGLEWRVAAPDEKDIYWGGLDLLPCPFTGKQPKVTFVGAWMGAPVYHAEALRITSWLVDSRWENAAKMRDAWNMRAFSV